MGDNTVCRRSLTVSIRCHNLDMRLLIGVIRRHVVRIDAVAMTVADAMAVDTIAAIRPRRRRPVTSSTPLKSHTVANMLIVIRSFAVSRQHILATTIQSAHRTRHVQPL